MSNVKFDMSNSEVIIDVTLPHDVTLLFTAPYIEGGPDFTEGLEFWGVEIDGTVYFEPRGWANQPPPKVKRGNFSSYLQAEWTARGV